MIIEHTPQRKIDKAMKLVQSALDGTIAWCYGNVHQYPLHEGREIRNIMDRLIKERMHVNTVRLRCQLITEHLKEYRKLEKAMYLFDEKTHKVMLSNYNRLKTALGLLENEGEVQWSYINKYGYLNVHFFTEHGDIEVREIENGQTYSFTHDHRYYEGPTVETPSGFMLKDHYYGEDENGDKYLISTSNNNTGHINKPHLPKVTQGGGELVPWKLKEKDKNYEGCRVVNDANYIKEGYEKDVTGKWFKPEINVNK